MHIDLTLIVLIFVILKVVGVISWPWWVIFLPLIIIAGFVGIIFALFLLVGILALVTKTPVSWKITEKKKEEPCQKKN